MNCIEFNTAFEVAVEKHESLNATMLEHVNTCGNCRKIWELNLRLESAINAWRFAEPPAGFVDSVIAALAEPGLDDDWDDVSPSIGTLERNRNRSSSLAMISVAACLLVAAIFTVTVAGKKPPELARVSPKPSVIDEGLDTPLDLSGTLTAVLSDLKLEYREMASESTSVARAMVNSIPQRIAVPVLPDSDEIQLRPNSSDMARIWQPIGSRVESALGFLWKAVPSEIPSG